MSAIRVAKTAGKLIQITDGIHVAWVKKETMPSPDKPTTEAIKALVGGKPHPNHIAINVARGMAETHLRLSQKEKDEAWKRWHIQMSKDYEAKAESLI